MKTVKDFNGGRGLEALVRQRINKAELIHLLIEVGDGKVWSPSDEVVERIVQGVIDLIGNQELKEVAYDGEMGYEVI